MTLFIQNLSLNKNDFSRYLPRPREAGAWGLAVTGGGRCRSAAGAVYPPPGHPADHVFSWDHGRMLGAWQLLLVTAGAGWFESAGCPHGPVSAGDLIVLFPGEWHRYRPDAAAGWTELWIELQGPVPDRLREEGVLDPAHPVLRLPAPSETETLLNRCHARLREGLPGFDPELAGWAWQLLATADAARRSSRPAESAVAVAVRRAESLLAERLDRPPAMPALARELGVAYSYFRREFRRRTGLSPHAYLLRLRLEKARRLLGGGAAPLKDIAGQLGFSSPYHLSAAFKKAFGISPSNWRRKP